MTDRELIEAMHSLAEELTLMAVELADRKNSVECAAAMLKARTALAKQYARIILQQNQGRPLSPS